jgi:hypothetical protein
MLIHLFDGFHTNTKKQRDTGKHMRLLQTYLGTADLALLNLARPIVGVPNKLLVDSWAMTTGLPLPKLG